MENERKRKRKKIRKVMEGIIISWHFFSLVGYVLGQNVNCSSYCALPSK